MKTLLNSSKVIICCGPGGVGKTTIAAAIGLQAAKNGRKVCVVTIDPARRLADSLGVDHLNNTPRVIEGPWDGELWAMMLDSKGTFDELVKQYAANDEQVQRILTNRIYHNLSTALSATQEYMAAEKLYEIYSKSEFDLIVVDTPPTRNALDFLEAPGRLTRFLENRFFRLILMPTRAYLKAFNVATRTFLHTVAKVAGSEVVSDALAFFQVFEGMEEGFINRAKQVQLLLSSDAVGFVVVTTAKRDATTEAAYFIGKLGHYNIKASALVINRIYPSFLKDKKALMNLKSFQRDHEEQQNRKTKLLISNLCDLMTISESENAIISKLVDKISISQVYKVPLMDIDIHDLDGLSYIGNALNT